MDLQKNDIGGSLSDIFNPLKGVSFTKYSFSPCTICALFGQNLFCNGQSRANRPTMFPMQIK